MPSDNSFGKPRRPVRRTTLSESTDSSYAASSLPIAHFGLGDFSEVDVLRVLLP